MARDRAAEPADGLAGVNLENASVEVEIRPDGTVRFHVSGLPGPDCERLEAVLVTALRGEVKEREHTPEFYQRVAGGLGQRLSAFLRRG